jgi:hypothetical protein
MAITPEAGSVKTPPDMVLISLCKKLGRAGMLGLVEPPP